MPVREGPPQPPPEPSDKRKHSAERVRGGRIILRTRTQRIIFIAGLAGAALAAVFLA